MSVAYLVAMGVEPASHTDTARDILLARDGLATGVFEGCDSSFGAFRQGVLWVRFMALTTALGLGPVFQHVLIAAWLVLGVCLFDWCVRKHFGEDMGWAPVSMFLPLITLAVGYPNLWNPTIASLGVVLLTWSLLEVVTRGSIGPACASGASLALTAEASWSAFLIGPVVATAVLMSCERPFRALFVTIAGSFAVSLACSHTTWEINLGAVLQEPWYLPFFAVALASALIPGLILHSRWLTLDLDARRGWLLVLLVSAIGTLALVASLLARRLLISPQYLFTALPAAVILVALRLRRKRRRGEGEASPSVVPTAVPLLLLSLPMAGALGWRLGIATGETSIPTYSMREARILARNLFDADLSFSDVQRHLRGPDSIDLMYSIAAFAPSPEGSAERPIPDLRVFAFDDSKRPADRVPPGGREVDLGRGRRAWIVPIEGWVGLAPSRVCFSSSTGTAGAECAEIDSPSIELHGHYRDLAFPSFPGVHDALARFARAPKRGNSIEVTWELPIDIDGADAERHVQLATIIAPPWVIERVEAVGYRGDLPSRHVVLDRSAALHGHLVVTSKSVPHREYPPEILETRVVESELRRSVAQLPPLGPYICAVLDTCPGRESAQQTAHSFAAKISDRSAEGEDPMR